MISLLYDITFDIIETRECKDPDEHSSVCPSGCCSESRTSLSSSLRMAHRGRVAKESIRVGCQWVRLSSWHHHPSLPVRPSLSPCCRATGHLHSDRDVTQPLAAKGGAIAALARPAASGLTTSHGRSRPSRSKPS
jgi:hypothetical protein